MNDSIDQETDWEVSSNDSWTFVDNSSRKSSFDNIEKANENLNGDWILEQDAITKSNMENDTRDDPVPDNSFLTFDEYFQEHLVEDNRTRNSNENLKERNKKNKQKNGFNLASLVAALLTISGLTMLFMLFPPTSDRHAMDRIYNNYIDVASNNGTTFENVLQNLSRTVEVMDVAQENNLIDKIKENISINSEKIEPLKKDTLKAIPEKFKTDTVPKNFDYKGNHNVCCKSASARAYKFLYPRPPLQATPFERFKELILNPKLQLLLTTIMQDLCMLKLVAHLNAENKTVDNEEKCELNKNSKSKEAKTSKNGSSSTQKMSLETQKKSNNIKKPSSHLKLKNTVSDLNTHKLSEPELPPNFDYNKGFKELENEWEDIGSNHRKNIQLIKEKFKNEVLHIKETNSAAAIRKEKILSTRQKYMNQIKINRERYLTQLKDLKEARSKILRQLCNRKRDSTNQKDASVGNYAVTLPITYDFKQNLANVREKENISKNLNISGDNLNKSIEKTPEDCITKVKSDSTKDSVKGLVLAGTPLQIKLRDRRIKYHSNKEKYLDKKLKVLRKPHKNIKQQEDIHKQFTSSDNACSGNSQECISVGLSEGTISTNTNKYSPLLTDNENTEICNISDNKLGISIKTYKARDAYELLFDKNGKRIKHNDNFKWNMKDSTFKKPSEIISKQDPQKTYKETFVFKGIL